MTLTFKAGSPGCSRIHGSPPLHFTSNLVDNVVYPCGSSIHDCAFEALPMARAQSEFAHSVTDGMNGLGLSGITAAADEYIQSLGPDPVPV